MTSSKGLGCGVDSPNPRGSRAGMDSYEYLRNEIVSARLMPNERLVETDLVARLGVGRAAIRQALARLHQEGLIVQEPRRGARVRRFTQEEASEILAVRSVLEGLAANHAAQRASREDLAEMRSLIRQMDSRLGSGDLIGYSETNSRFHRKIVEVSQLETVKQLIGQLQAQMVRFQFRTILAPGRPPQSFAEHRAVFEAIERKQPDVAERLMRHHITNVTATLSKVASTDRL